jgi:hypothetical protein
VPHAPDSGPAPRNSQQALLNQILGLDSISTHQKGRAEESVNVARYELLKLCPRAGSLQDVNPAPFLANKLVRTLSVAQP